jgi:predicted Zn-dependent protease with MMP-like domain
MESPYSLDDTAFEKLIARALDELPNKYTDSLDNVIVTYADEPTEEQRIKLKLRGHETLLGLYEGIPLTQRGAGYNLVLPDRITLFKKPLLWNVGSEAQLFEGIKHTLWHEIAHFHGLNHQRIDELDHLRESKKAQK